MKNSARILFSTLFELSKSYQRSHKVVESGFPEKIVSALENTPALFPASAKVACCGVPGAYAQLATDRLFQLADIGKLGLILTKSKIATIDQFFHCRLKMDV